MRQLIAFLLCLAVGVGTMPAQQITYGGTKETDKQTLSVSGNTLTFPDTSGTQTNSFDFTVTGAPATMACTVNGQMASGNVTTLGSMGATAGGTVPVTGGPFDKFTVTCTWTGGTSPTVVVERLGTVARAPFPPANGPWLYSNVNCAGSTLDARVSNCVNKLAGKCGVIDSRGEGNQTLAASMTNWQGCLLWLTPLGTITLPNNVQVNIPQGDDRITIWSDLQYGTIWDGSNNGSVPTIQSISNYTVIHGQKVLGGRLNSQAGTEIVLGQDGLQTYGDVVEDSWVLNAGSGGIVLHRVNGYRLSNNITEQSAGPGIQPQCGTDGIVENNWVYDAEVNKYTGSGDVDIICNEGPLNSIRNTFRNNHVMNGGFGPTVLGTNNGAAFGTATVTTGSTAVVWASGSHFVSTGLWSGQHLDLNGIDHQISSCADSTHCTLAAAYTDQQNFPAGGCGAGCVVAFVAYLVPGNPSYALCSGTAGANTGVSVTNGSTQVVLTNGHGDNSCLFLALMASASWNLNVNGTIVTVATFTNSTTIQLSANWTGSTLTNQTFSAYPTPTQSQTGGGECMQATGNNDQLTFEGNDVFNCVDEGYTAGNGSWVAVGNHARDTSQGCNGCAAFIDAIQNGANQQNSVHVGPFAITGNTIQWHSVVGVPTGGQAGFSNATGKGGFAVWLNVAVPATGSPTMSDGVVTGNVCSVTFGGSTGVGFDFANNSTAPATLTVSNVYVGGNAWCPGATNPVVVSYTNVLGSLLLGYPDNGGVNMTRVVKSSNQNFTSNAAANITGMSFPNLQPNTAYTVFCAFIYSASATGGLEITMSGPASPTLVTQELAEGLGATNPEFAATTAAVFGGLVGAAVVTATTTFPAYYHAGIQTGANGGTLQMQAASATNTITTTVNAGSTCYLMQG